MVEPFLSIEKNDSLILLNEKFSTYKTKVALPEQLFGKLVQIYDNIFECALLKIKLCFMAQKT
jgi:hypothetical protein